MPKASVLISTYNQGPYILECVNSILNQKTSFDFNVIIADDCSRDETSIILKEIQRTSSIDIKLIIREFNIGAAKNYLDLHLRGDGDVIFHIDGDDIMLPGKLQKQYDALTSSPDYSVCFHQAIIFNDDRSSLFITPPLKNLETNSDYSVLTFKDLALYGTVAVHSSYAYKKSSRTIYHLDREFMEWFFAMNSLEKSKTALFLNEPLVEYRKNDNNKSYSSNKAGRKKAYLLYLNDVNDYYQKHTGLRAELYANYLITSLGMLRSKTYSMKPLPFLFKNFLSFNLGLVLKSFRIRKSLSPRAILPLDIN